MFGKRLLYFLILVGLGVLTLYNSFRLLTGTYRISEKDIVLIGRFRLQSRAWFHASGKGGSEGYSFQSTNGYSFTLEKNTYQGIIDKKKLADTLMYHDLPFIAYSDEETLQRYRSGKRPMAINLLQLQVGHILFVDLEKANRSESIRLLIYALVSSGFLAAFARARTRKKFLASSTRMGTMEV